MINELYTLSRSLENIDVVVPAKHPWVEGIKKGEALLVNINRQGEVQNLEYCGPEQVSSFWNIRESNMHTFPKINLDPLWGELKHRDFLGYIVEAGKQKKWQCWLELADEMIDMAPQIACKKKPGQIKAWKKDKWTRLYNFSHKNILPCLKKGNEGLKELIHCFDSWEDFSEDKANGLFVQIAKKMIADLRDGRLDCFKLAQNLIIGSPGVKQQPQTTVIFNCSDNKLIVSDDNEMNELSLALSDQASGEGNHKCSLTGKFTGSVVTKFPSPNLPILGNTFLMAMNEAAACHNRYKKSGAEIFPVSSDASSRLDNVSRYITDSERVNKTWMSVTSGKWEGNPKKEKRDLLITYAADIPIIKNENLALLIGGDSGNEHRFEPISSIICDTLRRNIVVETAARLRFFVVRNISKGQSQVVLNDFCSFPQLMGAVEIWNKAAANHPYFALDLAVKKGEKPSRHIPSVPFPADLPRLLQYQWIREGDEYHKLDGCSLTMVYDLFFERKERTQSTARQALQMVLQRLIPLLIGVGRSQHPADFDIFNLYSIFAKKSVLQAVSFLGILLFKLGHKKEVYMKDIGFNIGRMLSLTDCLHREYCRHVRNGDIPNQLLGNAILRTVLDSPIRGLARLSERIAVYKAWIDRSFGDDFKLAHWAINQLGVISGQLADKTMPESTDDSLKAQILLGYLAHTESQHKI